MILKMFTGHNSQFSISYCEVKSASKQLILVNELPRKIKRKLSYFPLNFNLTVSILNGIRYAAFMLP